MSAGFIENEVYVYIKYLDNNKVAYINATLSQYVATFIFKLDDRTVSPWPKDLIEEKFGKEVARVLPIPDETGNTSYHGTYYSGTLTISIDGGLQTDLLEKYVKKLKDAGFVEGVTYNFEYTFDNQDVLEVREALEELAIKLACKRSTDDQVRRLKEAMERFENAIESGNLARIAQSDERFHNIIVEASHNKKLAEMTANLSQQIYRYRYECIKDSSMYAELIEEHRKMYESIYYRKQNEAVEVVKQHITKQQESIMRNLHLEEE